MINGPNRSAENYFDFVKTTDKQLIIIKKHHSQLTLLNRQGRILAKFASKNPKYLLDELSSQDRSPNYPASFVQLE